MTTETNNQQVQCPTCFGRGYKSEARKPSRRNPLGLGFYARNCSRCGGSGTIEASRLRKSER